MTDILHAHEGVQADLFADAWLSAKRTCGACDHSDPEPLRGTISGVPISYCHKRCTFERHETPRGEPWAAEYRCRDWIGRAWFPPQSETA